MQCAFEVCLLWKKQMPTIKCSHANGRTVTQPQKKSFEILCCQVKKNKTGFRPWKATRIKCGRHTSRVIWARICSKKRKKKKPFKQAGLTGDMFPGEKNVPNVCDYKVKKNDAIKVLQRWWRHAVKECFGWRLVRLPHFHLLSAEKCFQVNYKIEKGLFFKNPLPTIYSEKQRGALS